MLNFAIHVLLQLEHHLGVPATADEDSNVGDASCGCPFIQAFAEKAMRAGGPPTLRVGVGTTAAPQVGA
jgi:hypothetical protein